MINSIHCYEQGGWEGWKEELSVDCIQRKWPDVVLDLDGAAEQRAAHDAPGRQAREAKVQDQSKPNPSLSMPQAHMTPAANKLPTNLISKQTVCNKPRL
jgi:hypothetical protein